MTSILLGRILITVAMVLNSILSLYGFIVLAAVILSWLRPDPSHPIIAQIINIVYRLTEPLFYEVRKRLPAAFFRSGLDVTPIIVGLAIMVIQSLLVGTIYDIGTRLRIGAF